MYFFMTMKSGGQLFVPLQWMPQCMASILILLFPQQDQAALRPGFSFHTS